MALESCLSSATAVPYKLTQLVKWLFGSVYTENRTIRSNLGYCI